MIIDCDTCTARGDACGDCVVSFLTISVRDSAHANTALANTERESEREDGNIAFPSAAAVLAIDDDQARAVSALAASGLVSPLRHASAS